MLPSLKNDTKALEDVHHLTDRAILNAVKHISPEAIQTAIVATPHVHMNIYVRLTGAKICALRIPLNATIKSVKEAVEVSV
jgi:hypothetical protein